MAKFNKRGVTETPEMNTASMGDIVFILLFFFMVITTMRQGQLLIRLDVPQASEIQKLENKSLVSYIHIGVPLDEKKFGSAPRIQLNDQFAEISDIRAFIEAERASRNEADLPILTTAIKCDKNVKMGDVTDVKQELRQVGALKIMYSAARRVKDSY